MWKVMDNIVGEIASFKNYDDAFREAERRVVVHEHKGTHYPVPCKMLTDKLNKLIIINVERG